MADFSIAEDVYCLSCEVSPSEGVVGTPVSFTVTFDAGNGTPTGINALISDGAVVPATISGSTATFTHTFSAQSAYSVTMQSIFPDTTLPSDCGPYVINISA